MRWRRLNRRVFFLGLLLASPAVAQSIFTEVTVEAGILPVRGSRAALLGDYDHDGWPDLFRPWRLNGQVTLYHNEGNGQFTDHTAMAVQDEMTSRFKGGGSIFGDYDNDGDLDLFIPVGAFLSDQAGQNILLRNDQGVFHDVALEAGLIDSLPTDNALWFDYDRDGYLDLYLGNPCGTPEQSVTNLLYRNRGDGSFEDMTEQAGLRLQLGSTEEAGGCGGGSNGGMAAGDFNGDGWPDLYLAVFRAPNRLFLNDGQGHFRDATTKEIADPGEAFGVAVGDIDNDGDLDIFQTGGGNDDLNLPYRSPLLLNLGQGQFLDVTEGVGLGGMVGQNILIGTLGDIDNDGDLDLITGSPHFLYLNNGDGTFVDQTAQSGIITANVVAPFGFGDYDLDGFLDAWDGVRLYHNNGNGNHYLRVELVGVKSNRSGIGARVLATAGDLHQMREVLGGYGYNQDELVAHFGLGQRTQVDRLEIRWPSGQVDVLTDIPAGQKIRVFEGREGYDMVHPIRATVDTLVAGSATTLKATVWPALFEKGAQITQVAADLSSLGGPAAMPLAEAGAGTYRLEYPLVVGAQNELKDILITIDQTTSLGPYWTHLSRQVVVVPAGDLTVFGEAIAQGWQAEGNSRLKRMDLSETAVVHQGRLAGAFAGEAASSPWRVTFKPLAPAGLVGYTALRFAFHPGAAALSDQSEFRVRLSPANSVDLLARVDMGRKQWQVVEIPLGEFGIKNQLEAISFSGNFAGTFYLDDISLLSVTRSPVTVVAEDRTTALPQAFSLSQNFPNPFNSQTLIRFALPASGEVELAVYNLAGQRVVRLAEGARAAGAYTVRWDGRDGSGRELASGVYLYRLRAGEQLESRKLLLLQ